MEHPALPGIVKPSNNVEMDDAGLPAVAGITGDGAVGVAPFPHAIATDAARMTKNRRTLDQLEDHTVRILRGPSPKDRCTGAL